ncbi:ATP-dependent DNA helicase [Natranaerobius trueperi]|uniref:DNA 5'-3' helicase n=1 Tax=Natranaerobius trueperi TaxID=759412 RepID=A0A226BYN7_9FIRM|nr:helicase C-terminal domain-containing protein [Natranaerobius trueperi]OWZ83892.1 hypothetical protein CDO51_05760 [Natranaerobius trueperi]
MGQEKLQNIWASMESQLDGFEARKGQVEMSEIVLNALSDANHLVVEAGTGTGKSLGYLIPAVNFSENGNRIIISTATIALQEQLIKKDIPLLEQIIGRKLDVEIIKGRSNYLCKEKFSQKFGQTSLDNTGVHRNFVEWASETETGDRHEIQPAKELWDLMAASSDTCLGQKCPHYSDCFVLMLKRRAESSEVLITNHHLFFSDLKLRVDSEGSLSVFPSYEGVIFDEAHHIPEIATKSLGHELNYSQVLKLLKEITTYVKGNMEGNEKIVRETEETSYKAFQRLIDHGNKFGKSFLLREIESFVYLEEFRSKLAKLTNHIETLYMDEYNDPERPKMLYNRINKTKQALDLILDFEEEDYVSWVETKYSNNQVVDLKMATNPVSVSDQLKNFLFGYIDTVIMTSATLSIEENFSYFKKRVGLTDDTITCSINSPFNYKEQASIFVPRNFPFPRTDEYEEKLIEAIRYMVTKVGGKTLVLFTSYRMMNLAYEKLKDDLPYELLCQNIQPKAEILETFKTNFSSVLFATNSFREGIDVPGSSLQVVIMDKIPFSVPDEPLVKARMERLNKEGKSSFMTYSVPEAVLAVKQGFGRLIRNKSDSGIFILLDVRVHRKPYGKYFFNSLPDARFIKTWKELENKLHELANPS